RLSLPYFCPVPVSTPILDGGVQGSAPPGAGPYTIKDDYDGEYLILVRNPNYGGSRLDGFGADPLRVGVATGRAIPRVVAGHWDVLEDTDPMVQPGGIVARRFSSASSTRGPSYRAFEGASTLYLALDTRRAPFANPTFRRKLASAIDRRALAASVSTEPTSRLLPPGVRGGGSSAATAPRSPAR